jgi:hypothetical protein
MQGLGLESQSRGYDRVPSKERKEIVSFTIEIVLGTKDWEQKK